MAIWTISEFHGLPTDGNGNLMSILRKPRRSGKLTAAGDYDLGSGASYVRICGDTAATVKLGSGATSNDLYLPAGEVLIAALDGATVVSINTDFDPPAMSLGATANNEEATQLAHALTADETSTFAITGGADAAQFEISGTTLRWAADGVQDFADPQDADTDNDYVVEVTPTDAALNVGAAQTITVTVTEAA